MMRVSVISSPEIHHAAVYVKEGEMLVELAGRHPLSTLLKAIVILKYRKLKGWIGAKRKANNSNSLAVEISGHRDFECHREFAEKVINEKAL